jgi:LysR family transcriptional regulator, hypochlorite-specific transcription factor HypT
MQLKWIEDFCALAHTRNFARAAEARSVTFPAFGRRIKALEDWLGTELVDRSTVPIKLTVAGTEFLDYAERTAAQTRDIRTRFMPDLGKDGDITIVTGRTMARTLMADLLVRASEKGISGVHIMTRDMRDSMAMMKASGVDFLMSFAHPLIDSHLDAKSFRYLPLAQDRLVPVARALVAGKPALELSSKTVCPFVDYSKHLLLHHMVQEHLGNLSRVPLLATVADCDSPDAICEYVIKGLGVAWLPWSMVAGYCERGLMMKLGAKSLEVPVSIRLYRPSRALSDKAEAFWQLALDS